MFRSRAVTERLLAALGQARVVMLEGPRQVGKSTLSSHLATDLDGIYRTLDDQATRQAAQRDPEGFLASAPGRLLVIDEVQRAPELAVAIKADVDRDPTPGRFLVTGSTNLLSHPGIHDTLAGRATSVSLWPFSQGEIAGRADSFVTRLMAGTLPTTTSPLTRSDYLGLVATGGYPELLDAAGRHTEWLDAYQLRLQRDIAERGRERRIDAIGDLLTVLAGRTAAELNASSIAGDVDLKSETVRRYVEILRECFVVTLLPAFTDRAVQEGVRRPKLFLTDPGLACALLGIDEDGLARDTTGGKVGPLLETFVVDEIVRQLAWDRQPGAVQIRHHRRGDDEVDIVLQARSGEVATVEVKASGTAPAAAPRAMRALRDQLGDRFVGGVVLHTGPETVELDHDIVAAPISALWEHGPRLAGSGSPPPPSAEAPSSLTPARVFWSYAHADDDRDGGRIRRLAEAVKGEYELLTGDQLDLFVDTDLEWGDVWRDEIATAIDQTTMFVAVASPTYFRRPECVRELEAFLDVADRAGRRRMVLPLLYGPLPSQAPTPQVTRLIDRVGEHQWEDLTDLRLSEETSERWRRMVNALADRLAQEAREAEDHQPPLPGLDEVDDEDAPDFLDLQERIERLDPLMVEMTDAMEDIAGVMSDLFAAPQGLPPGRQNALLRANSRRAGAQLDGPLHRIETAIGEMDQVLDGFDSMFQVLVGTDTLTADERQRWKDQFEAMDAQLTDVGQVRGMITAVGRFSRDLRAPMRRLDRSFGFFESLALRARQWARALDD